MNKLKNLLLITVIFSSLFLVACPGGKEGGDDTITEENALEEADELLEDIENL